MADLRAIKASHCFKPCRQLRDSFSNNGDQFLARRERGPASRARVWWFRYCAGVNLMSSACLCKPVVCPPAEASNTDFTMLLVSGLYQ
jgi:hypothetical protein